MVDPDVISFAVVAAVIVGMVGSLVAIGIWGMRASRKKSSRELPNPVYEQRLDQIQQSIDAIAVEVERIAEAQRFSAKLLKERSETTELAR